MKLVILLMAMNISFSHGETDNALIFALMQIESSNDNNAVNIKENAIGCLQIRPIMIRDVNRILRKKVYTHKDAFNRIKSIRICKVYLEHYSKSYKRNTNKEATNEIKARMWNGGPKGYKKTITIKYFQKVKESIRERKW